MIPEDPNDMTVDQAMEILSPAAKLHKHLREFTCYACARRVTGSGLLCTRCVSDGSRERWEVMHARYRSMYRCYICGDHQPRGTVLPRDDHGWRICDPCQHEHLGSLH